MKTKGIIRAIALGLVSLTLSVGKINAQEAEKSVPNDSYKNAVGIRAGSPSGIDYKHRFLNNNAVEVIFGAFPYAFSLTGLYEKYMPTGVSGLNCYFGGGGHAATQVINSYGYYLYNDRGRYYYYRTYSYGPAFGIDAIMGIEYKIPKAPIVFSFDLKPNIEAAPGVSIYGNIDPGLGIKFTF